MRNLTSYNRFRINEEFIIELTGLGLTFIWAIYMNVKKDKNVKADQLEKELGNNKVLKSLVDKVLEDSEMKKLVNELEGTKVTPEDDSDPVYTKIKSRAKEILSEEEYKLIESYLEKM